MKSWTVNELATKYNVDTSTVCRWFRSGHFPNAYQKKSAKGNFWVAPDSDVQQFMPRKAGRLATLPESRKVNNARKLREKYKFDDRFVAEDEISEIIAYYRRGASQTDASIKFGLPVRRISKILKEAGVETRRHTVSKLFRQRMRERRKIPPKDKIIELYLERGLPRDEILTRLEISSRTFYQLLNYYEIPRRGFHSKN